MRSKLSLSVVVTGAQLETGRCQGLRALLLGVAWRVIFRGAPLPDCLGL
jgi:hypothetical protein